MSRTPAALLAFLLLISAALAQQTRAPRQPAPAAPKPAPIVVVTKADGTTLRGNLTAADLDAVTVTPPVTATVSNPTPVTIPWADIKTVSNGLTRAKLLADWKKEHATELCATCNGDRTTPCPTCKGTAHDPAAGKDCTTCKGELLVACKTPKCADGKIPCPDTCVKLSDGQWVPDGSGLKWRTWRRGGAWVTISERHLGEHLRFENGLPKPTGASCPTCDRAGVVPDPACHGTGKSTCPTCANRKDAPPCPAKCDKGQVPCETCKSTGLKSADAPAPAKE